MYSSSSSSSSSDYTYPVCIQEGIAEIEQLPNSHMSRLARVKKVITIAERHERERQFDSTVFQFCREYGALLDAAIRTGSLELPNFILRHITDNYTFFAWAPFQLSMIVNGSLTASMKNLMVLMVIPFHSDPRKSTSLLCAYAALTTATDTAAEYRVPEELASLGSLFLHMENTERIGPLREHVTPAITADRIAKLEAVFAADSVFKSRFTEPRHLSTIFAGEPSSPAMRALAVDAMVREGAMSREMLRILATSDIAAAANGRVFSRAYNMRYPDKQGMVKRGQLDDGYKQMVQHLAEPIHVPELVGIMAEYAHESELDGDEDVNHKFNQLVVSNARSASAMSPAAAASATARARNYGKRSAAGDHEDEPDAARNKIQARMQLNKW